MRGRKSYRRRARASLPVKKFFFLGIAFSILGGIFYFVLISGHFAITEIEISGTKTLSKNEISRRVAEIFEENRLGFLDSRNYFFIRAGHLVASLQDAFPRISNIVVKKRGFNALEVTVFEREPIGAWCSRQTANSRQFDCFYFDSEGIIFEKAPKTTGSLLLSVRDERDNSVSLGEEALNRDEVGFFKEIQGIVARNFPFGVRTFSIAKDGAFDVTTSEGWLVLLDKKRNPNYQLSNLKYILDEEVGSGRRELEYVDLRLGNRVYYKYQSKQE